MKVTLLGDSIRLIGYGRRVPDLLGGEWQVYQPEENCRFSKHTLRGIFDWKDEMAGSDVVHWNNGLWDTCHIFDDNLPFTPMGEYVDNVKRIAELLLRITPKVIFATTTPVIPGQAYNDNGRICEYNAAAIEALSGTGVVINDLYAEVYGHLYEYIKSDDKIHLNEIGIEKISELVANVIKETYKNN